MNFVNPFDDNFGAARSRLTSVYILLIAANLGAWDWAYVAFRTQPVLLGTAFLAYVFGLRHAFDADHIVAIDNVVRKLMQERKKPLTAGFFFSLGHSSFVVIVSVAVAASAIALQGRFERFHAIGGLVCTLVSALFLLGIGIANLFVLQGVWSAFKRARNGMAAGEQELERLLAGRGFLSRFYRPLFSLVSRSRHMYAIGFLFGLGFDTATEIGLLGISASQAAHGMNFGSVMVFPALFTAGMALVDTTDSVAMVGAYGWAYVNPARKLWYNLTITAASIVVAVFIGGVEALGLICDRLGFQGGIWDVVTGLNDNLTNFGYAVVGVFMMSWLTSTLIYRIKRYQDPSFAGD